MRPRVFPAEDTSCFAGRWRSPPGFNEAAGIPRGRRIRMSGGVMDITELQ